MSLPAIIMTLLVGGLIFFFPVLGFVLAGIALPVGFLFVRGRLSDKHRGTRRTVPLTAYTGPNGGSKTYCLVGDTIPTLESAHPAGRPWTDDEARQGSWLEPRPDHHDKCTDLSCHKSCAVPDFRKRRADAAFDADNCHAGLPAGVSCRCAQPDDADLIRHPIRLVHGNLRITDPDDGSDHRLWRPIRSLAHILEIRHSDVLLDEITSIAEARNAMNFPGELINFFMQQRKTDNVVRVAVPAFERMDKSLRNVMQGVVYCHSYIKRKLPGRAWPVKLFFTWKLYDAQDLNAFTDHHAEKLKPQAVQWHWRPRHRVQDYYNTRENIIMIANPDPTGTCLNCHGKIPAKKCSCGTHEPRTRAA